uniref:Beta-defensin n=1 Tax=Lynx canadensis TaxID=61383 RepID=A0A667HK54_LYNCA
MYNSFRDTIVSYLKFFSSPLRTDVGFSPFPPFVSGSTEKCWNLRGSCREKCIKNEKIYVFCTSGKLCCVKPKFQPKSLQT